MRTTKTVNEAISEKSDQFSTLRFVTKLNEKTCSNKITRKVIFISVRIQHK